MRKKRQNAEQTLKGQIKQTRKSMWWWIEKGGIRCNREGVKKASGHFQATYPNGQIKKGLKPTHMGLWDAWIFTRTSGKMEQ